MPARGARRNDEEHEDIAGASRKDRQGGFLGGSIHRFLYPSMESIAIAPILCLLTSIIQEVQVGVRTSHVSAIPFVPHCVKNGHLDCQLYKQ